jgi:hypothetical protein
MTNEDIREGMTTLREAIEQAEQQEQEPMAIDGNTSDGYHTFNELYEFRKAYNVALFNEWAAGGKCSVHKSWRHHDGELCFGGGWFIVVAVLPDGQISNHYEAKDWNLFAVPETPRALFEFDGHTGSDVIERLKAYTHPPRREWRGLTDREIDAAYVKCEGVTPDFVWYETDRLLAEISMWQLRLKKLASVMEARHKEQNTMTLYYMQECDRLRAALKEKNND